MTDVADVMNYMTTGSKKVCRGHLKEMAEKLGEEGMPAELCIELQYKYPITFNGNRYSSYLSAGDEYGDYRICVY